MDSVIYFIRHGIPAYIAERRDQANHEYELFCQRLGIKLSQRVQEQRGIITWDNAMTDDEFVGRNAEIQTNEHFMRIQQQTHFQPISTNNTSNPASGSKQDTTNSQYQTLLGLTPPDEIDMLFSDTQSNESMPKSSIFYNTPSIRDSHHSTKRVSFYKNMFEGRDNVPKQTPSPIRKQKTSPVFKRKSTGTQTPLNLRIKQMSITNSYDIDKRLTRLEEEVPIVQNRVYRLLNGHMIETDAYSVTETPPLPQRISNAKSIISSSPNTNSTPRTPSRLPSNYNYTPKTPGSVMRSNNVSHPIYHYHNHSPNNPASPYKHTTLSNTNYSEYDISSLRRTLKPTKQHKTYMRIILYQMAFTKLRKTDMIIDPSGELVPNPFWEEIYGEKYIRV